MPRRNELLADMPPAGKAGAVGASSSMMSETLAGYQPPATPDHLKPYRKSGTGPIGGHASHYAKGKAFAVDEERRFGRANCYSESTATRFAEMREPVFQPKTRAYASELKEPLGKAMTYGFKLPETMQAPEFRFGKSTLSSEPVKTVMYPPEGPGSMAASKEPMYQTQRGYDWAKVQIDPTDFRFGVATRRTHEEVYNPTELVPLATVEQRRQITGDAGKPCIAGFAPVATFDGSFSRSRATKPVETMRSVLMQEGDTPADLGTTTTKSATLRKLKAQDRELSGDDSGRVFGMPSIRADKAPPAQRSIASNTNFGDEPSANQLLFPAPDTGSASTKRLATVDDAEVLANRCKFGLSRSQVEQVYGHAARQWGPVTAESFKRAVDELDL